MGILIGIAVIFLIMFILGVSREMMVFIALAMLFIFSLACVIFFAVSFIILVRSGKAEGIFSGLVYPGEDGDGDNEEQKKRNRMGFASYTVAGEVIRNLFPTDDFMEKLYKKDIPVPLRVLNLRQKKYAIDGITKVIIFIGLPVFSLIAAVLVPLLMQYMYLFHH